MGETDRWWPFWSADEARWNIDPPPSAGELAETLASAVAGGLVSYDEFRQWMNMVDDVAAAVQAGQESAEDKIVADRQAELDAQLQRDIRAAGEAGWKYGHYVGEPGYLGGKEYGEYGKWRRARDDFTVSFSDEDKAEMLSHVTFTNPPEAREVLTGKRVRIWHDIDGRPHQYVRAVRRVQWDELPWGGIGALMVVGFILLVLLFP